MKTVDQLKQEAAKATRALELAEEAARKTEREAKEQLVEAKEQLVEAQRKEAFLKEYAKHLNICNEIVKAAIAQGLDSKLIWLCEQEGGINGGKVLPSISSKIPYCRVDIKQESHGSGFFSKPTGKLRINVGDCGNNVGFPQKKDGSFSFDKIAERMKTLHSNAIVRQKDTAERQAKMDANTGLAQQLNLEFSTSAVKVENGFRSGHNWHTSIAPVGRVYVELGTRCLNEEQARIMLTAVAQVEALIRKDQQP